VRSRLAAPYVINTNDDIIALGGFSGSDNVPTVAQLDELVRQGTLKFVVADPASLGDLKRRQQDFQLQVGWQGAGELSLPAYDSTLDVAYARG